MNRVWNRLIPNFIRTRLAGRHNLQKIITNIGWLSGEQLVRMGVSLLVGVWVARYLGPEQYGLLNYAISLVALFGPLTLMSLNRIAVRDIVRDPANRNITLGTTFVLKLLGSLLVLFLSVQIVSILRPGDILACWLVAIIACGTVFKAFDVGDLWFQSQVQSKYSVWVRISSVVLSSITRLAFILRNASVIAFAFAILLDALLTAIGLTAVYEFKGNNRLRDLKFKLYRAKSLLRDGWAIIISSFAIAVQARIDQVMLGQMLGDEALGYYSVAIRLISVFGFIPIILSRSVAPAITTAKNTSETSYYQKIIQAHISY